MSARVRIRPAQREALRKIDYAGSMDVERVHASTLAVLFKNGWVRLAGSHVQTTKAGRNAAGIREPNR